MKQDPDHEAQYLELEEDEGDTYDEYEQWEPSCEMDCELCGCHGNCYDCGTEYDDEEEDG